MCVCVCVCLYVCVERREREREVKRGESDERMDVSSENFVMIVSLFWFRDALRSCECRSRSLVR